jgi:hypothetical protein
MPRADLVRKSNALSVKLINIAVALLSKSQQENIYNPARIISFILPTPGIFLTGKSAINLYISVIFPFKNVYASGLLKSAHTLASNRLLATPHEAVRFVFENISFLILSPTKILPKSLLKPLLSR